MTTNGRMIGCRSSHRVVAGLLSLLACAAAFSGQASGGAASVSPAASKPSAGEGPSWSSLTAQQRAALAPLARDWPTIEASRKTKWLEVAARFPAMPAADQQRVQERMGEWARMTPAERGRARLSFQESKQFSPEQKQARWEAYQALPDDQRRALAERNRPGRAASPRAAAGSSPTGMAAAASATVPKPVTPTVVQAGPGATTTLMNRPTAPPAHQRPGQPKIAADAGQVDRATLLPHGGPQATASAPRLP